MNRPNRDRSDIILGQAEIASRLRAAASLDRERPQERSVLVSSHYQSHRLSGTPGKSGIIEATTDRSARDAALVHSDVLRERRRAGRLALPRIEQAYLSSYTIALSVASAQALLWAAASGMMALTGIVFAMAFVMVQFSAIAYSPRLVLWFARDRTLFDALGAFTATFLYALFTLAWVDRGGSAKVPLFSMLLVGIMIIVSMLMFSRLMQRLGDLQIGNVLHLVGDQGRAVIGEMYRGLDDASGAPHPARSAGSTARLGRVTQTVTYLANRAPSPRSTSLLLSRRRGRRAGRS